MPRWPRCRIYSLLILAASPNVQRVVLDRVTFGTVERTGITVGATAVRHNPGYDGAGVGVAVIDSGVTAWHDDLGETGIPGSQRVDRFVDFVNGHTTPYDDHGHGTHVAGIIAGNGHDSGGARSGMAPRARLVVMKVLGSSGQGHISNLIAALDYVVTHKDLLQIRVVNLSVGAGVYESYESDLLTLAAKRVVDEGIVVVAAAGNAGRNAQNGVQYGAILAPANAPWVLTVGASSHMGTVDRADDTIAAFSSRGPTAKDYAAKPDLVAPGVGTYSLSDPNSALYSSRSAFLLSGTVQTGYLPYLSLSGTSQSAPVVAGVVALMLQANPSLTPNAIKGILQYTAQEYSGNSALTQGAGYLNAVGAVELARLFGTSPSSLRGATRVERSDHLGKSQRSRWASPTGSQRVADGCCLGRADQCQPRANLLGCHLLHDRLSQPGNGMAQLGDHVRRPDVCGRRLGRCNIRERRVGMEVRRCRLSRAELVSRRRRGCRQHLFRRRYRRLGQPR